MKPRMIVLLSVLLAPLLVRSQAIPVQRAMLGAADVEPASVGNVHYVGVGITTWGTGDIGAQINAAYAALPASGGTIVVVAPPNGACYSFSTPIVAAMPGKYLLLEGGALASQITHASAPTCLNYVPTAANAAITLDYIPAVEPATFVVHGIQNLTLINNRCERVGGCGSGATGIAFGGPNGGAARAAFVGLKVIGFGTGLGVRESSSRSSGLTFRDCTISYNTTGFLDTDADGGHISFDACHFQGNATAVSSTASLRISNSWMESNTVVGVNCSAPAACDINSDHFENAEADSTHFLAGNGVFSVLGGDMRDDQRSGNTDWWMNFAGASFFLLGTVLTSEGRTATHVIMNEARGNVQVQNNSPDLLKNLYSSTASMTYPGPKNDSVQPTETRSSDGGAAFIQAGYAWTGVGAPASTTASTGAETAQSSSRTSDNYANSGNLGDILMVGGAQYKTIAAAVKAAGSRKRVILIPSNYQGGGCPALSSNLVFWDFRGSPGGGVCENNTVMYNFNTQGNTNSLVREQMTVNSVNPSGSALVRYSLTACKDCTNGNVLDGVSNEAQLTGTFRGKFGLVNGNEQVASILSTGGSVAGATGGLGYVFNIPGNTTEILEAHGLDGIGCRTTGVAPLKCYGLYAHEQFGVAKSRNYSAVWEGAGLAIYSGNQGVAGFDMEDSHHKAHRFIYQDSSGFTNIQAVEKNGLVFESSEADSRMRITSGGVQTYTSLLIGGGISNATPSMGSTGFQHNRVPGCPTAAALNAACDTPVSWISEFVDMNYTVQCTGSAVGSGVPIIQGIVEKKTSSVMVRTLAATAAAAQFSIIECTAVHD